MTSIRNNSTNPNN